MVHDSADDRIAMASFRYGVCAYSDRSNPSSIDNSNTGQWHKGSLSELIELLVRSDEYFMSIDLIQMNCINQTMIKSYYYIKGKKNTGKTLFVNLMCFVYKLQDENAGTAHVLKPINYREFDMHIFESELKQPVFAIIVENNDSRGRENAIQQMIKDWKWKAPAPHFLFVMDTVDPDSMVNDWHDYMMFDLFVYNHNGTADKTMTEAISLVNTRTNGSVLHDIYRTFRDRNTIRHEFEIEHYNWALRYLRCLIAETKGIAMDPNKFKHVFLDKKIQDRTLDMTDEVEWRKESIEKMKKQLAEHDLVIARMEKDLGISHTEEQKPEQPMQLERKEEHEEEKKEEVTEQKEEVVKQKEQPEVINVQSQSQEKTAKEKEESKPKSSSTYKSINVVRKVVKNNSIPKKQKQRLITEYYVKRDNKVCRYKLKPLEFKRATDRK